MTTNFKVPQPGNDPLSTDAGQYALAFNGTADVGQMQFVPPQATPAAPTVAVGSAGNLNGAYLWKVVLITGWQQSDNSYYVSGFAPSADSTSLSLTNAQGSLSAIATGTAGTIGRAFYRTAAGGASGTEKYVGVIWDNSTTTFTDNVADANIGTGMPTSTSTPAVYGVAIPASVPTGNTTGTSLAGINALAYGPALNGLWHFENDVNSTRGLQGTFSRGSVANDPTTLANIIGNNTPRFASGKFGNGVFIEEGTTNLVYNSDFETVTGTATVFSDPLTSGAAWTTQSGSFTYAAGGATSGANGSIISAGNVAWKPILGSDGLTKLALTAQATHTTPTTVPSNFYSTYVLLMQDINNSYHAHLSNAEGKFELTKRVGGTYTNLATVSMATSASTTYTTTLSVDNTGLITAKLYNGTGTGGTLLQTLTATDTSLAGGFLIGVGGDTGVVISGAQVTAPWADGWAINAGKDAWALTQSAYSGSYSVSLVSNGGGGSIYSNSASISASTTYTGSLYQTGASGHGSLVFNDANLNNMSVGGSTWQRNTITATSSASNTTARIYIYVGVAGTASFDAVQIEQKTYATSYMRNDSTSASATRNAETLTIPTQGVLNANAGTISMWAYENGSTAQAQNFLLDTSATSRFTVFKSNPAYSVYFNGSSVLGTSIPTIGWHMLTIKWNGTAVSLYIDGVLKQSATLASAVSFNGSSLYVGCSYGGAYQWDNTIDELAIFNRALSDAEVYSLYATTVPLQDALATPIAPDVANYNAYMTSPDSNDIYQTVTYKRPNGTIYMVSTASNPDVNGNYQTITWKYYDATGTVVTKTTTWAVTYDSYGKITQRVMQ